MNKCVKQKLLGWAGKQLLECLGACAVTGIVCGIVCALGALSHRLNVSFDDAFMALCCGPVAIISVFLVAPICAYIQIRNKVREFELECRVEEESK